MSFGHVSLKWPVSSDTTWFTRGQGARLGEANASGGGRVCKSLPLLSCKSIIATLRQELEMVVLHVNCTKNLIKRWKLFPRVGVDHNGAHARD